jgi:hypothetical protein
MGMQGWGMVVGAKYKRKVGIGEVEERRIVEVAEDVDGLMVAATLHGC